MKFGYTILYVRDVPASLAFWREAFGIGTGFLHESGDYGELATGETTLAFSSIALMRSLGKTVADGPVERPSFEVALVTGDVAGAMERAVRAGAKAIRTPEVMPWGQTIAYVRTPDGTLVELCTAVTPGA